MASGRRLWFVRLVWWLIGRYDMWVANRYDSDDAVTCVECGPSPVPENITIAFRDDVDDETMLMYIEALDRTIEL